MKKFVLLQRDFGSKKDRNKICQLTAKNSSKAWEKVEESCANNSSQEWLLEPGEFFALQKLINRTARSIRKSPTSPIP